MNMARLMAIDIPLTKEGQTYKLKLIEDTPGSLQV